MHDIRWTASPVPKKTVQALPTRIGEVHRVVPGVDVALALSGRVKLGPGACRRVVVAGAVVDEPSGRGVAAVVTEGVGGTDPGGRDGGCPIGGVGVGGDLVAARINQSDDGAMGIGEVVVVVPADTQGVECSGWGAALGDLSPRGGSGGHAFEPTFLQCRRSGLGEPGLATPGVGVAGRRLSWGRDSGRLGQWVVAKGGPTRDAGLVAGSAPRQLLVRDSAYICKAFPSTKTRRVCFLMPPLNRFLVFSIITSCRWQGCSSSDGEFGFHELLIV